MLLSRYQMRMKILIPESVSPSLEKRGREGFLKDEGERGRGGE
jgi:hypothetical protein